MVCHLSLYHIVAQKEARLSPESALHGNESRQVPEFLCPGIRGRALERLIKEKGHTDTSVIEACIELCDNLNGEALKSLHAEEPDQALVQALVCRNASVPQFRAHSCLCGFWPGCIITRDASGSSDLSRVAMVRFC